MTRDKAARLAAPLIFLAALTIAVLLVRAGMNEADRRHEPAITHTSTKSTKSTKSAARYYRVRPGDTLGAIAPRFGLTDAELVALNPGIEPTALHIGQRIRVR